MMTKRTALFFVAGAAMAVVLASLAFGRVAEGFQRPPEPPAGQTSFVPGEVAVRLEDGTYDTRPVAADSLGEVKAEAREIEAQARVEAAGPNYVYGLEQSLDDLGEPIGVDEPPMPRDKTNVAPDDNFYVNYRQPNLSALKVPAAWDDTRGAGVRVAVVDAGWYRAHPELQYDVVAERDFVDGDALAAAPADTANPLVAHHGTMVGGLAAGETNNGRGIAAPGWAATVLMARACTLACESAHTAPAVDWAVANGAKVINLSFGSHQEPPGDPLLGAAVQRALAADVVVVASAGNTWGYDASRYPVDYPGVLGVGSTVVESPPKISLFSRRGPGVDVVAPSEVAASKGIVMPCNPSVQPSKNYCNGYYGTSYSTAQVSGIAALVRAFHPGLAQNQVVARIQNQADDYGPVGRDDAWGHGEADAKCSVRPAQSGC